MQIKTISLTKSKTVGVVANYGKTHFKKVQIMAQADLTEQDDPKKSYEELSQFLESRFEYEKDIK